LEPEIPLGSGKIHDSNSYTLSALLAEHGAKVIRLGIAPDRYDAIQAKLDRAVEMGADLIITSAGVSVGNLDLTRSVVQAHGTLDFWRVNMRPGKPVAFGSYRETPFIGLPGNPGSAFVGFLVFVAPVLARLGGEAQSTVPILRARLTEPIDSDGRESYLRAVIDFSPSGNTVRLTGHQGSGNLFSFVQANALLIVPSGVKSLPTGSEVDVWLLGS
jgi:molybdopterin molybdotransferase